MRFRNTHTATFATLLALITMTGLTLSSCTSSAEPSASPEVTTLDGEESKPSAAEAGEVEAGGDEAEGTDDAEFAAVIIFDVLATEPTVAGPRPELAWSAVEGAASYDLIVLDGAGEPYWAWSGEATNVYLGGVQNADAVGAWVFEPLTWIVTARDSNGEPLAMSARAKLLP